MKTTANRTQSSSNYATKEFDLAARARALESILLEKKLVSSDAIERLISSYENDIGPMLGAKIVAKAWANPAFRKRMLENATAACRELDIGGMEGENMVALENTPTLHNVVVCTLCSCYPWPVLGLPPNWYKSPQYRSKIVIEPRKTLREDFGLNIGPEKEIKVWDSSAEIRYLVLPERPEGTEKMTEAQLASLVTRESMIGVGVVNPKKAKTKTRRRKR
ncbi:MAG TPA: nitrile hydratase subunit alpha [Candidatus Bathyarchaeia archaeon]|nr:nitrile hydratase subunit alpha [Candidatus Bathyarchaeia archaeon]